MEFQEVHVFLDTARDRIRSLEETCRNLRDENERLKANPALDPARVAAAVIKAMTEETQPEPVAETIKRAGEQLSKPKSTTGFKPTPKPSVSQSQKKQISDEKLDVALPVIARLGKFTGTELGKAMKLGSSANSYPYVNALLEEGTIRRVGPKGVKGTYYVVVGSKEDKEAQEKENQGAADPKVPAQPSAAPTATPVRDIPATKSESSVSPEDLTAARDWAVKQPEGRAFPTMELTKEYGWPLDKAMATLSLLAERGILEKAAVGSFIYHKPTDPGAAAKLDIERRRTTNGDSQGSIPVSGTGRGIHSASKEIQEILDAARRRKFKVEGLPSGHFVVTRPDGVSDRFSSSPGHQGIQKERMRARKLGVFG